MVEADGAPTRGGLARLARFYGHLFRQLGQCCGKAGREYDGWSPWDFRRYVAQVQRKRQPMVGQLGKRVISGVLTAICVAGWAVSLGFTWYNSARHHGKVGHALDLYQSVLFSSIWFIAATGLSILTGIQFVLHFPRLARWISLPALVSFILPMGKAKKVHHEPNAGSSGAREGEEGSAYVYDIVVFGKHLRPYHLRELSFHASGYIVSVAFGMAFVISRAFIDSLDVRGRCPANGAFDCFVASSGNSGLMKDAIFDCGNGTSSITVPPTVELVCYRFDGNIMEQLVLALGVGYGVIRVGTKVFSILVKVFLEVMSLINPSCEAAAAADSTTTPNKQHQRENLISGWLRPQDEDELPIARSAAPARGAKPWELALFKAVRLPLEILLLFVFHIPMLVIFLVVWIFWLLLTTVVALCRGCRRRVVTTDIHLLDIYDFSLFVYVSGVLLAVEFLLYIHLRLFGSEISIQSTEFEYLIVIPLFLSSSIVLAKSLHFAQNEKCDVCAYAPAAPARKIEDGSNGDHSAVAMSTFSSNAIHDEPNFTPE